MLMQCLYNGCCIENRWIKHILPKIAAVTISFVAYSFGLIIFSIFIAIIFYRFAQTEEIVRQSQVESLRKSIQLMNSIRTKMITLKIRRILVLQESAKKMLFSKETLMKNAEAIETKLSPITSRLLNRQRSILQSNSNISTHKKLPLSKSIISTPHSTKNLMKSLIGDKKICK
ncbi:Rhomboid domain-containing protein [Dirofilaria immitis]